MHKTVTAWRLPDVPLELLTPSEMGEADRRAAETIPSIALMEAAGTAVAEVALASLRNREKRVLIFCGPGNNGGDGYVAARRLREAGRDVRLHHLVAPDRLSGDAARAASQWEGPSTTLDEVNLDEADLVIDALFGAGLARPIEGRAAAVIERLNLWAAAGGRVLAVDIPSGIDGATGAARGPAVKASATVTFFRLKPGHILLPGRLGCGEVTLADIGIASAVLTAIGPRTWLNHPRLWRDSFPVPRLDGHKYARGHAVVVSGPLAQTGAARLCARGALRAGAGLVTVATSREALPVHAAALTAVMTRVVEDAGGLAELLEDPRKNSLVLGPGLGVGSETREFARVALARSPSRRSTVLDADALTSFAATPDVLFRAVAEGGQDVVLTPHDGEFAKLFGGAIDPALAKPERARRAAALSGAIVVLKGPDTVVAAPDGRAAIAASEAPWLATAGSGDVLAGMIAGLLAQEMPVFEAAAAAVWLHADVARNFGPGLISEDIPDHLPRALKALVAQTSVATT